MKSILLFICLLGIITMTASSCYIQHKHMTDDDRAYYPHKDYVEHEGRSKEHRKDH